MIFKVQKKREKSEEPLTPRQRDILLHGTSQKAGRGFLNESERLAAYTSHRSEILWDSAAKRPDAYIKYEITADNPPYIEHVRQLLSAGLFKSHELAWLEDRYITLSPDQPVSLHAEFQTPSSIRSLNLTLAQLEVMAREAGMAEAFHCFRNRPALAEKYQTISAAIREVLAAELTTNYKGA